MTTSPADAPGEPRFVFDDGAAYERMMGRWSALVAQPSLDWLALPPGLAWLDDSCGNGSFTEALVAHGRPASVVGIDPSPAQLAFARQRAGTAGVRFVQGDAQSLPLPDGCIDAAVMALVLFFVPDPARGLRERVRERLAVSGDGPLVLNARANAVKGRKSEGTPSHSVAVE